MMARRLTLQAPDRPARAGWSIDVDALAREIATWGLTLPVVVRYSAGQNRVGSHGIRAASRFRSWDEARRHAGGWFHSITLSQDRPYGDAADTLWHELRHAMQAERWAADNLDHPRRFYRQAYRRARGRHGASYRENSYELDARHFAASYAQRVPLLIEGE
jgi:hypothetical protein